MFRRFIIAIATLALLATACGDDASVFTTGPGGAGNESISTTASGGTTGAGGEATTTAASGDFTCATLVTLDEAAALFGEPAMFDAEASQDLSGLGAGTCVYSSIEDENNLEDMTSLLLQVQVYRGAEFYQPDVVAPDAEPIEGIGDNAYVSQQLGVSTGFVDGDLVGFVTYSVIDLSGEAPTASTRQDQVIELLRLVHDRLT
jgi:hypothetical protein